MAASRHQNVPIPPTTLTVIYEPESGEQPSLDVVFIHGFTGHPERTWTHKHGDPEEASEPPQKRRKMKFPFAANSTPVYWPRDLLPKTLPNARILTYGYDTNIRHRLFGQPLNTSPVYDMAGDLLVELEAGRRKDSTRPLLFIVHSLGGVLVKEALRQSEGHRHHHQTQLGLISQSTIGIIFFGTPHGGADPRGPFLHTAEAVIRALGVSVNEHVLATLMPTSERLKELRNEFNPVIRRNNWLIYSFQEGVGLPGLNGKVVEDSSSYLNLPEVEIAQRIGRNHKDMCRFTGYYDIEYQKVIAAVTRITENLNSSNIIQLNHGNSSNINTELREKLIASLKFDQIDSRQDSIRMAHAKTCAWILKKQEYLDWLGDSKLPTHHGFLWMKGKPGSGKSTLMKFTLRKFQKAKSNSAVTVIYFFFNGRGADLEKTTKGMYRSLLSQLLEKLPQLHSVFDSERFGAWKVDENYEWSVPMLEEIFRDAILALGSERVSCFVDALDECNEDEIRAMVRSFQDIGETAVSKGIHFRIFFSSRYYPQIDIGRCLSLELDGQEGHTQDIDAYINSELRKGDDRTKLQLRERSFGVFMWVVLVVDILNRTPPSMVNKKLAKTPRDLLELFRSILTRDDEDQDELRLCIQWLLFTRSPLQPAQFYLALNSIDPDLETLTESASDLEIEEFIRHTSKGLAEITKSKIPVVQFIHESVRDFLLKENGLRELWPDVGLNLTSFQAQSHEALKQCCLGYLGLDFSASLGLGNDKLPKASSKDSMGTTLLQRASQRFLFLEYATSNIFWHADNAQAGGVQQHDFLRDFPLGAWFRTWLGLHNIIQQHDTRRYRDTLDATLLYVLAEGNLLSLLRICPQSDLSFIVEERERYRTPFLAALACKSHDVADWFVERLIASHNALSADTHLTLKDWKSQKKRITLTTHDFSPLRQRGTLSYAVEHGDEILTCLLLNVPGVNINQLEESGRSLLTYASEKGHIEVAKVLLKNGADLGLSSSHCPLPLMWAIEKGHEEMVNIFLDNGADIESLHGYRERQEGFRNQLWHCGSEKDLGNFDKMQLRTPLGWAAQKGHLKIARLLSGKGADSSGKQGLHPALCAIEGRHVDMLTHFVNLGFDLELKNTRGQSVLHFAAAHAMKELVEHLLQAGADMESRDLQGRTPLHLAAQHGRVYVIRALLRYGGDIEAKTKSGCSPLMLAIRSFQVNAVECLLESGADANSKDCDNRSCLSHAIKHWNSFFKSYNKLIEEVVRALLQAGNTDLDSRDRDGRSPLSYVAALGISELVRNLIESKMVDIDSRDKDGRSPLSYAAEWGTEEVVRDLIYSGKVDVDSRDRYGRSPLSYAAERGNEKIVRNLINSGKVDVDSRDKNGRSPLSYAAERGKEEIVRDLINSGKVDVDSRDKNGRSPLSYAAGKNEAIVRFMLATGTVDPDSRDSVGRSPLSYSAEASNVGPCKLLLGIRGMDADQKDLKGITPLSWAIKSRLFGVNLPIGKLLLETGQVDMNSMDDEGKTPLSLAVEWQKTEMLKLLLNTGKADLHTVLRLTDDMRRRRDSLRGKQKRVLENLEQYIARQEAKPRS